MKVSFYFDWYAGIELKHSVAYIEPPKKLLGNKRYKFTVDLPDPNDPDVEVEIAPHNVEEVE